jgi:hypothetical protein
MDIKHLDDLSNVLDRDPVIAVATITESRVWTFILPLLYRLGQCLINSGFRPIA